LAVFKNQFAHRREDLPVAADVVPPSGVEGHLDAVLVPAVVVRLALSPVGKVQTGSGRDPKESSLLIRISRSQPHSVPNVFGLKRSSLTQYK